MICPQRVRRGLARRNKAKGLQAEFVSQWFPPIYCAIMLLLVDIAEQITKRRKTVGMSQTELAKRALVSRSTLESLENGRIGELGYAKVNRILIALGLEFKMQEMNLSRPTLDELMIENEREDALLRRSTAARIHRGVD
jgi:transcriptional regulator with XRE-family HTH domain